MCEEIDFKFISSPNFGEGGREGRESRDDLCKIP